YAGTFRVRPGPRPALRVRTVAAVRQGRLAFTAHVECRAPGGGEVRALAVRLRRWEGGQVRLQAPPGTVAAEHETPTHPRRGEHSWVLALKPGVREPYRVTLTGSVPLEDAVAGLPLPDVTASAPGAGPPERVVELGEGLAPAEVTGLAELADPARALAGW